MKGNRGITLIALVVTIIVLLILAGVSIVMLTGQNGLLSRSKSASTQTIEKEAKELTELAISTVYMEVLKTNPTQVLDFTEPAGPDSLSEEEKAVYYRQKIVDEINRSLSVEEDDFDAMKLGAVVGTAEHTIMYKSSGTTVLVTLNDDDDKPQNVAVVSAEAQ